MSGQATGWVLRNGPRPEHLHADGRPYGQRARGLRSVLVAVADAANADGHHAHPGLNNVAEFALYSRRQALSLLADLVSEGWLVVEVEGGGKGRATQYGVPMPDEDKAQLVHPLTKPKGAISDPHTVQSESHTVQSAADTVQPGLHPNGLSNEPPTVENNGPAVADAPVADPLKALCDRVWEALDPKPAKGYIAMRGVFVNLLASGWTPEEIETVGLEVETISAGWMEPRLKRLRGGFASGKAAQQQKNTQEVLNRALARHGG